MRNACRIPKAGPVWRVKVLGLLEGGIGRKLYSVAKIDMSSGNSHIKRLLSVFDYACLCIVGLLLSVHGRLSAHARVSSAHRDLRLV
jgi:hypothetical protein